MITLTQIFGQTPIHCISSIPLVEVSGIATDSRKVQPGHVFFALSGDNTDGYRYIPQAVANGAVAIIGTRASVISAVPYVQIDADERWALAQFAAAFYNFPARKLTIIGVTGTDGKTTTTNMIHHILRTAGIKAGMVSTVNAVIGDKVLDTGFHVTTPDAPDVQNYLAQMVAAGITHVVLETTSHGLAQQRVSACDFDIAVVTNVTHEHLDYHGNYENYLAAKGRLFEFLAEAAQKQQGNYRIAVLNREDSSYAYLNKVSPAQQISYGVASGGSLWADGIENTPQQLRFNCHVSGQTLEMQTSMIGLYNVANIMAALGATVLALGIDAQVARQAIKSLPPVPGRMERIDLGQNFIAIVDFAHTPNALKRALETVRQLTPGRVIAVFGSAGLRDREKRRMMPEVSAQLADFSILTAEDPRTESLDAILADMAEGAVRGGGVEGKTFLRVPDRGEAIRQAVQMAEAGDVVIACGKGHEQSMCFGVTEYLWDDRTALRAALAEQLGLDAPPMPKLPDL